MILDLESLSHELLIKLRYNSLKLGTAESCTGGMIAQYLTMHPGSSEIFSCGLVTYSNESKINLLGIKELEIKKYGAVSKEVTSAMAFNLLKQNNIDISIAVSGIAGPGGGTEEKPVGLVHHAMAIKKKLIHKQLIYNGERETIRKQAVETCLKLILNEISQL